MKGFHIDDTVYGFIGQETRTGQALLCLYGCWGEQGSLYLLRESKRIPLLLIRKLGSLIRLTYFLDKCSTEVGFSYFSFLYRFKCFLICFDLLFAGLTQTRKNLVLQKHRGNGKMKKIYAISKNSQNSSRKLLGQPLKMFLVKNRTKEGT